MRVLIAGAGIAGPTLAYWLNRYGLEPTIVEKAPARRTGGYLIDFWGAGFDVADRMDLLPVIRQHGYQVRDVRVVDDRGRRVSGFPVAAFARVAHGRYTSLPRGDLAAAILDALEHRVETMFGTTIQHIESTGGGLRVSFDHQPARTFDLVVGADGLHSRVRDLIFGPQARFERYLGVKVAAFEVAGYRPRDELVYVMHTGVGQQVTRFAMRDDRTLFLLTFADDRAECPPGIDSQKALLRRRFEGSGWECPQILDAMDAAPEVYFDRVSQIHINPADGGCSKGRVALVGDAASCVSLLAGEGSGLAMAAAYLLAGELHRAGGDYARAFARYRSRFEPFVARKQRAARRFAGSFAPRSRWSLAVRNQVFRMLSIPGVVDLVAGRGFTDNLALPAY